MSEPDQQVPTAPEKVVAEVGKYTPAEVADAVVSSETGGPRGLEPTRYGDWEKKGRCIDF